MLEIHIILLDGSKQSPIELRCEMSKQITIRDDLYEKLKATKELTKDCSFSDVVHALIRSQDNLQETTITQEGRISKTLAGKTILFRVKE